MEKTIRKETIEEFDDKGKLIRRTITEETIEETPDPQPTYYPYWGIDRSNTVYCNDSTTPEAVLDPAVNDANQCTIEDFFNDK